MVRHVYWGFAVCVAILAVAACGWYVSNTRKPEQLSPGISPGEIELAGVQVVPNPAPGSFKLLGKLTNKSRQHTLDYVRIRLQLSDCQNECNALGETTAWIWQDVAPGQTESFEDYVYLPNAARSQGRQSWSYSVVEVVPKPQAFVRAGH